MMERPVTNTIYKQPGECGATCSGRRHTSPNVYAMHEPGDRLTARQPARAGEDSTRLATVITLPSIRRRTHRYRRPNRLSAWTSHLLASVHCEGTVRAVLHPSITWDDLIDAVHTDPRLEIAHVNADVSAAIDSAWTALTHLDARPRINLQATLAPGRVLFVLHGILADPVMTPERADTITATLQSNSHAPWWLQATDHGTLTWQLGAENLFPHQPATN